VCRVGCSVAAWPTGARGWARGGGDVWRSRRPMAEGSARWGESAVAAWHQPKPPRVCHGRKSTVAAARASDRRHSRASACTRNWGTAGRRGVARCDIVRGSAGASNTVSFTPFQIDLSPKLQTEVLQTLNTKLSSKLPSTKCQRLLGGLINRSSTNCRGTWPKTRRL
jgi:hypothetical protein